MKGSIEEIINKNFLIFTAAISVILIVLVFSFFPSDYKNKKAENPVRSLPPKEKTMEEIIQSFSASPKSGEKPIPLSSEVLKTFSAISVNSTVDPKNNKITQPSPSPTPIPEDILKSFSAQPSKR